MQPILALGIFLSSSLGLCLASSHFWISSSRRLPFRIFHSSFPSFITRVRPEASAEDYAAENLILSASQRTATTRSPPKRQSHCNMPMLRAICRISLKRLKMKNCPEGKRRPEPSCAVDDRACATQIGPVIFLSGKPHTAPCLSSSEMEEFLQSSLR